MNICKRGNVLMSKTDPSILQHMAMRYGEEWNEKTGFQDSHWRAGGQQPFDIVSSTRATCFIFAYWTNLHDRSDTDFPRAVRGNIACVINCISRPSHTCNTPLKPFLHLFFSIKLSEYTFYMSMIAYR